MLSTTTGHHKPRKGRIYVRVAAAAGWQVCDSRVHLCSETSIVSTAPLAYT